MKINEIILDNFRIYRGNNKINLSVNNAKNINLIAGKNGFGKTTFLTSLIWVFYGRMMIEVEEKYKKEIKSSGGYGHYLNSLLNREIKNDYDNGLVDEACFSVEISLTDVQIPALPCQKIDIKRTFDYKNQKENLLILIDGLESELTNELGLEVFINDFILPREIAKFFFFDAEKIVSLAEAKSKSELRNLSKAYSEVLGIKKYEDLKKNLETLLTKLRRNGANEIEEEKLEKYLIKISELEQLIQNNIDIQNRIEIEISNKKSISDNLQEKLIREGNSISVEDLKELKSEIIILRTEQDNLKKQLKSNLEIIPLAIVSKKIKVLIEKLDEELYQNHDHNTDVKVVQSINNFSKKILKQLDFLNLSTSDNEEIKILIEKSKQEFNNINSKVSTKILLDYNPDQVRAIKTFFNNLNGELLVQFQYLIEENKRIKFKISKINQKIKQAEARKDNPLVIKIREEKDIIDQEIIDLYKKNQVLISELGGYKFQLDSNKKVLSELEKNFTLAKVDKQKYVVTEELLNKIKSTINLIKTEKKYSLQKSIKIGLEQIMHKKELIKDVKIIIDEDVMDILLIDNNDKLIDKESLSKGEQQLYATALLKALVDESGINFPIFIDSPLQKFDKFHSKNIIENFYPNISEQVVLFPLLVKELSEDEYELLKLNINKVFMIENENNASQINEYCVENLFKNFNLDEYVFANQN